MNLELLYVVVAAVAGWFLRHYGPAPKTPDAKPDAKPDTQPSEPVKLLDALLGEVKARLASKPADEAIDALKRLLDAVK